MAQDRRVRLGSSVFCRACRTRSSGLGVSNPNALDGNISVFTELVKPPTDENKVRANGDGKPKRLAAGGCEYFSWTVKGCISFSNETGFLMAVSLDFKVLRASLDCPDRFVFISIVLDRAELEEAWE